MDEENEILLYEQLGDFYVDKNNNQAYLCYENAEYLCSDVEEKQRLKEKKEKLKSTKDIQVRNVSIVIVSYNSCYLMQKCVESIRDYCAKDAYELVVVDNASTDGVKDYLAQQKDILPIFSNQNLGFPIGCNIGIQYANKENDIFLLNNDTRMTPNALFWLRMGLYEKDDVGATGCVANYCGNDQQMDVEFPLPQDYIEYGKKVNIPIEQPYEERNRLCGFAMLLRKEVVEQVKGFDINFTPGYLDDDDLSIRIRRAGYRLLICHNSFIYHAGSQSFCKRDDLREIYTQNYYYLLNKWGYDIPTCSMVNVDALNKMNVQKDAEINVLEIGSGSGSTLSRIKFLYPNAKVYGIEACKDAVIDGVESEAICIGDYKNMELPFQEKFFDYIICTKRGQDDLFEKIEERMATYLKDDGKII